MRVQHMQLSQRCFRLRRMVCSLVVSQTFLVHKRVINTAESV